MESDSVSQIGKGVIATWENLLRQAVGTLDTRGCIPKLHYRHSFSQWYIIVVYGNFSLRNMLLDLMFVKTNK